MINRIDGFIEEKNGDKYLNIALAGRNSELLKKYSEVWNRIKDCIKKINGSELGEYGKDHMKYKFNSDDDITLNKVLNFPTITVIIRNVFEKDSKYHPQSFLDECLYEVCKCYNTKEFWSEGMHFDKTNKSVECMICHYWYFKDIGFKYQPYVVMDVMVFQ